MSINKFGCEAPPKITLSGDLKADFVSESLDTLNSAAKDVLLITPIKIEVSQVLILCIVAEHAVYGYKDAVSNGYYSPLVTSSTQSGNN